MIIGICLLLIIRDVLCRTSIVTYPVVNLMENTPNNTFVISVQSQINQTNHHINRNKYVLLNFNDYELSTFTIIHGAIYTINHIDREEFLNKKYCLDYLYCKIELHIIINDGLEYLIIPIHILDENDNAPRFYKNEIELKFDENIINGYRIPFEGAKDIDEGENSDVHYILDCSSNDQNKSFGKIEYNHMNVTSINCNGLFQLLFLSKSTSALNYDKLALKFLPSSSSFMNINNEYRLKLYAIDKNHQKNHLNINIKIKEKEKVIKFSLSKYEFVVILDYYENNHNNKNSNIIGRVYASSNNQFDRIYYKLLLSSSSNLTNTNLIEINSLTGQLTYINTKNSTNKNVHINEIEYDVEASILSSKVFVTKTKVKIYFRWLNKLNNLSIEYEINKNLSLMKNQIIQMNKTSNQFLVDKNIPMNEILFNLFIDSFDYLNDKFILSLENHLQIFSLSPSSSSSSKVNSYQLKVHHHFPSLSISSIYMLNIGIKHHLSQQWLSNLRIELIIIDQWITSTIPSTTTTTPIISNITSTQMIKSTTKIKLINESKEYCLKDQIYRIYNLNKTQVGLIKVLQTNFTLMKSKSNEIFYFTINETQMNINGCHVLLLNQSYRMNNKSSKYQICLLSSSSLMKTNQCYYIKSNDEQNQMSRKEENELKKNQWLFIGIKSIEKIMLILSIIFVLITILLILIICRIKQMNLCMKIDQYIYERKQRKKSLSHRNHFSSLTSSPSLSNNIKNKTDSMCAIDDIHSSSFQSIRIKDHRFIFTIDDFMKEQHDDEEALPSTSMFVLPSIGKSASLSSSSSIAYSTKHSLEDNHPLATSSVSRSAAAPPPPPRTSSSSSFLQETKQLLDMISNHHHNLEPPKLVSEV